MKACARLLKSLSGQLCEQLLKGLRQVLQDEPALEALEESVSSPWGGGPGGGVSPGQQAQRSPLCPQLEQGLCCGRVEPLQGPVGDILKCLVLSDGTLVEELAGPIAYLLEALTGEGPRAGQVGPGVGFSAGPPGTPLIPGLSPALSETQHVLLAQALEAKALSEPLQLVRGPDAGGEVGLWVGPGYLWEGVVCGGMLQGQPPTLSWQVESLLEQTAPWQEPRAVSLPSGLLGSSWGPEVPTWTLLEACGLELQVDAPQASWKPEAQGRTCALYACLTLLLQLSQLC